MCVKYICCTDKTSGFMVPFHFASVQMYIMYHLWLNNLSRLLAGEK